MLSLANRIIGLLLAVAVALVAARLGAVELGAGVVVLALLLVVPSRMTMLRSLFSPSRHIAVSVEQAADGAAALAVLVTSTSMSAEVQRQLRDVAEGCLLPPEGLRFEPLAEQRVTRVSSTVVSASPAWETFARMASRVPGISSAAAVAPASASRPVRFWLFEDAKLTKRGDGDALTRILGLADPSHLR